MSKDKKYIAKFSCTYEGFRVVKDGTVYAKFKSSYINISDYILAINAIGLDCILGVKYEGIKPTGCGKGKFNKMTIDRDGEATIELYGDGIDINMLKTLKDNLITMIIKSPQSNKGDNNE